MRASWGGVIGRFAIAFVLSMLVGMRPEAAAGHDQSKHRGTAAAGAGDNRGEMVGVMVHDLELLDVEGRPRAFASDVLEDRIVAVSFIYTSCTTVCPIVSSIFAAVQDQLDDQLAREVRLVSLTIDPATDVPARLGRYASNFEAGDGWIFLTGERDRMSRVLAGLGAYAPNFEDHPSMVLVGDAQHNRWRRLFGFPAPEDIIDALTELAAFRQNKAE